MAAAQLDDRRLGLFLGERAVSVELAALTFTGDDDERLAAHGLTVTCISVRPISRAADRLLSAARAVSMIRPSSRPIAYSGKVARRSVCACSVIAAARSSRLAARCASLCCLRVTSA